MITELHTTKGELLYTIETEKSINLADVINKAIREKVALDNLDLTGADLHNTDIWGLKGTDISFINANLSGCKLIECDISKGDFNRAIIYGSSITDSKLKDCFFGHTIFASSSAFRCNFEKSCFGSTNLVQTRFTKCKVDSCIFNDCTMTNFQFFYTNTKNITVNNMPELPDGEFIGWKKVNNYLVMLKILGDSKRSISFGDKCRCDKALVLEITDLGNGDSIDEVYNDRFAGCLYKVGSIVYADRWDENKFNTCSNGIHFFVSKEEAKRYLNY